MMSSKRLTHSLCKKNFQLFFKNFLIFFRSARQSTDFTQAKLALNSKTLAQKMTHEQKKHENIQNQVDENQEISNVKIDSIQLSRVLGSFKSLKSNLEDKINTLYKINANNQKKNNKVTNSGNGLHYMVETNLQDENIGKLLLIHDEIERVIDNFISKM